MTHATIAAVLAGVAAVGGLIGMFAAPNAALAKIPEAAAEPTPAISVQPAAHASNQFMSDLYGKLAAKKGNLFFSPYSVSSALTLLAHGAQGQTATEINATLHLPKLPNIDASYSTLIGELQADNATKGYQLSVANAIWTQQGESFQPAFLNDATKTFHAGLEAMNFITDFEPARAKINEWVAKQTNDKIKDLMPRGSVTADTRLVITNAVYFKGEWSSKFKKAATQQEDFHAAADKAIKADLMHQKHGFNYAQDDTCQALELPYKGNELAMLVLLPPKTDADCQKLEAGLNSDYIRTVIDKLAHHDVIVTLPKWKFTLSYNLVKPLQELGIKDAFSPAADFSGINGRKDLSVTAVIHKAYIDVNEEFTEAAGATGIAVGAMAMRPEPSVEFRADRPFVYLIYHRTNRAVLFVGRLADPTVE